MLKFVCQIMKILYIKKMNQSFVNIMCNCKYFQHQNLMFTFSFDHRASVSPCIEDSLLLGKYRKCVSKLFFELNPKQTKKKVSMCRVRISNLSF